MSEEAGFVAAIAATPDGDTPRLAFADWLDEHDRPGEAELIRVQCELEPVRDRHGEPRTDELHRREQELLLRFAEREGGWLRSLGRRRNEMRVEYRRGFPDALLLPARWLVEHGADLRDRYPLLRKLVVFRLNGWGRELAASPHLAGVRELELPCWYADEDAEALARSPHLADLEVLTYWSGDWHGRGSGRTQLPVLAASATWPRLRKLRVMLGGVDGNTERVNATAGRAIADVPDPAPALFPLAADFHPDYFVGRLADGRLFFAHDPASVIDPLAENPVPELVETTAQFFDAAGNPTEQREVVFPRDLIPGPGAMPDEWGERRRVEEDYRTKRVGLLHELFGFVPAFIRVKYFRLYQGIHPYRTLDPVSSHIGATDDSFADLEHDYHGSLGHGESVYNWVTRGGFVFDPENGWDCDATGHVTST